MGARMDTSITEPGASREQNAGQGFRPSLVHDANGRRWDSYTGEEVAALERQSIGVQTEATRWSCYCPAHEAEPDCLMPVGTKCVWVKTSYEYDEWDCHCLESWRQQWIDVVTTDWSALAKEPLEVCS